MTWSQIHQCFFSLFLFYLYGNLSIQVNETTVIRESWQNSSTVVNFVSVLSDSSVLFKTVSVGHPPLQMLLCGKQAGGYEMTKLNIFNSSLDNRLETAGFTNYITVILLSKFNIVLMTLQIFKFTVFMRTIAEGNSQSRRLITLWRSTARLQVTSTSTISRQKDAIFTNLF